MAEDILNPAYWARRLKKAPKDELHKAIFQCPLDKWARVEARHREILARHIKLADSILDVGCGWGRLLTLLPHWWGGGYGGIDLSPDFIEMARRQYPSRAKQFVVGSTLDGTLGELAGQLQPGTKLDWAVMISMRPMIRRELGAEAWERSEKAIRAVADKLLYLEYDENDEGSVE